MITLNKIILMGLISFLFIGCASTKTNYYISSADKKYKSHSVETDFIVMSANAKEMKGLGSSLSSNKSSLYRVVSAVDNKELHYTLIAPKTRGISNNSLSSAMLYHSVTLQDEHLKELLLKIDYSIKNWGKVFGKSNGYNASHTIEGEDSLISYNYQNTKSGSIAFLKINTGKSYINPTNKVTYTYVYEYKFKKLSKLKLFNLLLEKSLNMNHN